MKFQTIVLAVFLTIGTVTLVNSADPTQGAETRQGSSTIFINEVMARNTATIPDPDSAWATYPDWVELYNGGTESVYLDGMYLSDSLNETRKWQFPGGTTIDAGGYLLVWADGDPLAGALHTNWGISGNGETVCLFAPDGETLVDSVSFGPQSPDISYGRYPDGGDEWSLMRDHPSPGFSNSRDEDVIVPGSLFINEFMADNDATILSSDSGGGDFSDWLELYNGGDEPVDLGGMYLTDNLEDTTMWQVPHGTVLGPGDFLLIWADNDGSLGPLHADLRLGAEGDELALYASDGITPIDSVVFFEQNSDISFGRLPDGGDDWSFMLDATPGGSNRKNPNDSERPNAYGGLDQVIDRGDTASFDASVSTDNMGIINYTWSFAYQGQEIELYGPISDFLFEEVGTYDIDITVEDVAGNTDTHSFHVVVQGDVSEDDGSRNIWVMVTVAIFWLAAVLVYERRRMK